MVAVVSSAGVPQWIVGDGVVVNMDFLVALLRGNGEVSVDFWVNALLEFNVDVAVTASVVAGNVAHGNGNDISDALAVAASAVVAMLAGKVVWTKVPAIDGLGAEAAVSVTPTVVLHDIASVVVAVVVLVMVVVMIGTCFTVILLLSLTCSTADADAAAIAV